MANLRVNLTEPLLNGMDIKFKAPCNCTAVTGLIVYAPDNEGNIYSQTFSFKDAQGNNLAGLGNLFAKDALVKVMVDTDTSAAYIQNAATNAYLEEKIGSTTVTEVDLSGSVELQLGQEFTSKKAMYATMGRLVTVWLDLNWKATTNGSSMSALVRNLPNVWAMGSDNLNYYRIPCRIYYQAGSNYGWVNGGMYWHPMYNCYMVEAIEDVSHSSGDAINFRTTFQYLMA